MGNSIAPSLSRKPLRPNPRMFDNMIICADYSAARLHLVTLSGHRPRIGSNPARRDRIYEVAYNSLLIERRKLMHERAGQALESIFPEQLDDHLTQLAHHYSHSDNVSKAVEYLGRAGQQAMQRSAYADAINDLVAAIDLLQRLPDGPERIQRELALQLALGSALIAVKGWAALEV